MTGVSTPGDRPSERPVFGCCGSRGYHAFDCRNNPHREENLRNVQLQALSAAKASGDLVPYDLEADAHVLWPNFEHEHLAVGDLIDLKRDGEFHRQVRVTRVIPGPDGQVMYETEPE